LSTRARDPMAAMLEKTRPTPKQKNAGALLAARGASADGLDASFATNTLGGLVLAVRLLPALTAAPGARVVFVSSGGMYTGAARGARHEGLAAEVGSAAGNVFVSAAAALCWPSGNTVGRGALPVGRQAVALSARLVVAARVACPSSLPRRPAVRWAAASRIALSACPLPAEPLELSGWEDASRPWDGIRAYSLDKRRQVGSGSDGGCWPGVGTRVCPAVCAASR
jgi:hypothetical protein